MIELRAPLETWLEDQDWATLPGITRTALEEQHAQQPLPPELHVKVMSPSIPMPEWLRIDLGLPPPEPEWTPTERALDILRPHLAREPLYQEQ